MIYPFFVFGTWVIVVFSIANKMVIIRIDIILSKKLEV